jgi:tol-pal system protein YbgF
MAAPAAQAPAPPVLEGKREPATPAVQALYDRGYTLYHQKHYVDAEASFQRFLQAEPQSELADNAQYWIGECRYSRGDMRGALAAFRETVARYPTGNKTADALLKEGMSLENLGDKEAARNTYQEVLRRFPGTAVAAVAEERRTKLP